MKKIELSEEKKTELLTFFLSIVELKEAEACLESTEEISPIEYAATPKDWGDAETDFFNTAENSIEERGAFRKMIEIMGKEEIASTVDNLNCLPKIYPEELTLLVRKIAELLQAEK